MPPLENEWSPELKEALKDAYHAETDLAAVRADAYAKLPKSHVWRQRGPYVICQSCHPEHSQYVGTNKNLTVDERGDYVLVDRF